MCGGFNIQTKKTPEEELNKFYSPDEVENIKSKSLFEGHFWDRRPVLPAEKDGQISLFDWGNRDKEAPFPLTGWARQESIDKGKWKWLKAVPIKIPIEQGYEKKVWFDMPKGTEGILIEKDGDKRVYMITEESSPDYKEVIDHPRMPVGEKTNYLPKGPSSHF